MASVNWNKVKTKQEVKGHLKHDFRLNKNNSNEHIKAGVKNVHAIGENYEKVVEKYDELIAINDNHVKGNKRKDRVSLVELGYTIPDGIDQMKALKVIHNAIVSTLTESGLDRDCVISHMLHLDERHYYTDKHGEMQESQTHGHLKIVPLIDGRLNAKELMSRKNMIDVNRNVNDAFEREFGFSYNTGNYKKGSSKSVETLKMESESAEALFQANNLLKQVINQNNALRERIEAFDVLEDEFERMERLESIKQEQSNCDRVLDELNKFMTINNVKEKESLTDGLEY